MIVLLLIRIRLISLLELGASGPSPLLGELPQSLLFITFCSLSSVIFIVKLKRMFCVFCASLRQRTSSQYLSVSAQSEQVFSIILNKVVNLNLRNDLITV